MTKRIVCLLLVLVLSLGLLSVGAAAENTNRPEYTCPHHLTHTEVCWPGGVDFCSFICYACPINPDDPRLPEGGPGIVVTNNQSQIFYDITVLESENGVVESNRTSASMGDVVMLTAKPAEGYALAGVLVTDDKGKEVPVRIDPDGKLRFSMPESDVWVLAAFGILDEKGMVLAGKIEEDRETWFFWDHTTGQRGVYQLSEQKAVYKSYDGNEPLTKTTKWSYANLVESAGWSVYSYIQNHTIHNVIYFTEAGVHDLVQGTVDSGEPAAIVDASDAFLLTSLDGKAYTGRPLAGEMNLPAKLLSGLAKEGKSLVIWYDDLQLGFPAEAVQALAQTQVGVTVAAQRGADAKDRWQVAFMPRVGYLVMPQLELYVTAGSAVQKLTFEDGQMVDAAKTDMTAADKALGYEGAPVGEDEKEKLLAERRAEAGTRIHSLTTFLSGVSEDARLYVLITGQLEDAKIAQAAYEKKKVKVIPVVGAGLRYSFTPDIFENMTYMYTFKTKGGSQNQSDEYGGNAKSVKESAHIVKLGVGFRF